MAATYDTPTSLIGKVFDCSFGEFVPRLTVLSPTELRVQATIGGTEINEIVEFDVASVRPGLFIMSWTEQNGTFVVQVQDHDSKVVTIMRVWRTGNCFGREVRSLRWQKADARAALSSRPSYRAGVAVAPYGVDGMSSIIIDHTDPAQWDPQLDAVIAAPHNHTVLFENDQLRVLEVTLEPNEEEPIHHHRWPSVFVSIRWKGRFTTLHRMEP